MKPNLYRGQPPAKGILHVEQRSPARPSTAADGALLPAIEDPRGYWLGQHTNKAKNAKRKVLAMFGARQVRKAIKADRIARRVQAHNQGVSNG